MVEAVEPSRLRRDDIHAAVRDSVHVRRRLVRVHRSRAVVRRRSAVGQRRRSQSSSCQCHRRSTPNRPPAGSHRRRLRPLLDAVSPSQVGPSYVSQKKNLMNIIKVKNVSKAES